MNFETGYFERSNGFDDVTSVLYNKDIKSQPYPFEREKIIAKRADQTCICATITAVQGTE